MTPISRTSERIDIVHVQDQTKICLYLGQELIMANSVLQKTFYTTYLFYFWVFTT